MILTTSEVLAQVFATFRQKSAGGAKEALAGAISEVFSGPFKTSMAVSMRRWPPHALWVVTAFIAETRSDYERAVRRGGCEEGAESQTR